MLPRNRSKQNIRAFISLVTLVVACLFGGFGALRVSKIEANALGRFVQGMQVVQVSPPSRPPVPGQEDLEIAMALFSIATPRGVAAPLFDPDLDDRGLTTGATFFGMKEVSIGPAAFSSWAVLGSTLGHEIEVHGRQSFGRIALYDKFQPFLQKVSTLGLDFILPQKRGELTSELGFGTWAAEREAYQYELNHATRFGLSEIEVRLIRQVMNTYYPSYAHPRN